jgi:hypothetical protein
VIKAAGGSENRLVFNPLYDAETMIRVNDLVADLKCHGSPSGSSVWKAEIVPAVQPVYVRFALSGNENARKY